MLIRRLLGISSLPFHGALLLGVLAIAPGCSPKIEAQGDDEVPQDEEGGGDQGGDGGSSGGKGGSGSVAKGKDPGTVAMRRMNKTEYNNTVRDLLGTALKPADDFTFEDRYGYGFDNNAKALDVDDLQLEGYTAAAEKLASEVFANATAKAKILTCSPSSGDDCIKTVLKAFMTRAFRRQVTDAEVTGFAGLVKVAKDSGDTAEVGVQLAIQAILTSPHFLYRIELDPDPASKTPHAVGSYEMASRLSYFLWSTMPDPALFAAADGDKLKTVADIKAQVARMLKDPKADAFIDTFGALWTPTRLFDEHEVDLSIHKKFTPDMRMAMKEETRGMLRDLFTGAIGFNQFMNSDYTYANDTLAEHYGLTKPGSTTLKKVSTVGSKRAGLLTQGSFLAATSQPSITSIIKRGKYVYEKLLCGEVGEVPPDVNTKLEPNLAKTARENLEAHEKEPRCASCHKLIDPPGFTLENYDAIGGYRTMDRNLPIDPKVSLETEEGVQTFNTGLDMAKYISTSPGYARCITSAVYTFSLGRGPVPSDGGGDMDDAVLDGLRKNLESTSWKFTEMVNMIVSSEPFRMRRANIQGVQ